MLQTQVVVRVVAGFAALLIAACTAATVRSAASPAVPAGCCLDEGLRVAEQYRVAAIDARRFTHSQLWTAMQPSLSSPAIDVTELGRSVQNREIRALSFGDGATTVLLWSQMHGDESTATMSLADIFRFLAESPGDPLRERLHRHLTLVFVPMLNPDGAELFQRENAAGVDINRDARQLATPEGRALHALRQRLDPAFGFNLHDQSARTRAGRRGLQVGIALLAPPFNQEGEYNDVRSRARLVTSVIARTLAEEIPGRVAKYDEGYSVRAFGDAMQRAGTSTVLIESGALPDDPQKQRLRALNVVGILAALDAIATNAYRDANPADYDSLPANTGGAVDLLVLGGQLVLPGREPRRADLAINFDDAVARTGGRVRDVGDLRETVAIDTIHADGMFIHADASSMQGASGRWLRMGAPAVFDLRRGAAVTSELVRRLGEPAPPR